jgi:hypothetical protein
MNKAYEKRWNELAILVDKLNKIKSKIVIDHFWFVRVKCEYLMVNKYNVRKCMHKKHFETSTGKTYCTMDDCPILIDKVTDIEDY